MGVRWESGLEARSGFVWSCGRICSTGRNQLMPVSGVVPDVENARQACDLYSAQQIRKPHRACARSGSRACLLHGEAAFWKTHGYAHGGQISAGLKLRRLARRPWGSPVLWLLCRSREW